VIDPRFVRHKTIELHEIPELDRTVADHLLVHIAVEVKLGPLDVLVQAVAQKVQLAPAQLGILIGRLAEPIGGLVELQDGFPIGDYALDLLPAAIKVPRNLTVHGHNVVLSDGSHTLLQSQHVPYAMRSIRVFVGVIILKLNHGLFLYKIRFLGLVTCMLLIQNSNYLYACIS